MGPGHYVSTDLTGSRTFGGTTDPQVYVTVLKQSARILDVRQILDQDNAFKAAQRFFGCSASQIYGSKPESDSASSGPNDQTLEGWVAFFRNSPTSSCRKVIIQALANLDIGAILYTYNSARYLLHCRHNRGEALVIIQSSAFDPQQIAYFSSANKFFDPLHTGGFLKQLYEEGLQDYLQVSYWTADTNIPAAFLSFQTDNSSYEAWKQSHIYKCGPAWKSETSTEMDIEKLYEASDRDLNYLTIQVTRGYNRKFSHSNFRADLQLLRLRGFNQMMARLAQVDLQRVGKSQSSLY